MATAFNPQYVNLDRYEAAQIARRANQQSPLDAALQGLQQGIQLQQLPETLQNQQLQRQLQNAIATQKLTDLANPQLAAQKAMQTQALNDLLSGRNPNLVLQPQVDPELQAMRDVALEQAGVPAPTSDFRQVVPSLNGLPAIGLSPSAGAQVKADELQRQIQAFNARPRNPVITKEGYRVNPITNQLEQMFLPDAPDMGLQDQRRLDAEAAAASKAAIAKDRIDSAEKMLGRKLDAQELARLSQNEFKSEESDKDRALKADEIEIKRLTLADKRAKLASASNPVADAQKYTDIVNSIDDLSKDVGYDTVGFADWLKAIPTTPAQSFATRLEGLKAAISLGELAAMKAASKTGGSGLGSVSNFELKTLQDAKGRLNQANGPEDFKEQLGKVRASYQRLIDITKEIDLKHPDSPTTNTSPKISGNSGTASSGIKFELAK